MEQLESNKYEPTVRELLRLSQVEVTDDAQQRLGYAREAYELGLRPEIVRQEPAAAGEAAARAGLATSELRGSMRITLEWFKKSEALLSVASPKTQRQLLAAWLLKGQSFHRIASQITAYNQLEADRRERSVIIARRAFENAEDALVRQHTPGDKWDRHATLASHSHGQFELDFGSPRAARNCALSGIARAIGARRERDQDTPFAASLIEHSRFVLKYANANGRIFVRSLLPRENETPARR